MMPYQRILVATDLSPSNRRVIEQAKTIATQDSATLDIVHVIEYSTLTYGSEFSIPVDFNLEQAVEKQARQSLSALGNTFSIPKERQHLFNGSVKQAVIDLAEKLSADLIVVGTHSHHGIDKLLGSRANGILHGALCDVLTIRAKE